MVAGLVLWVWYLSKRKEEGGLEKYNEEVQAKKKEAQSKIMALFGSKDKICNSDVQKLLGISQSSATRYLDDLEAEGKIKQIGKIGQSVFYTK